MFKNKAGLIHITLIVGSLIITGCARYTSVYSLPFGEKSLRKRHIIVHRDEIWNLEKGAPVTFDDMIDTLTDRTVVYVGEIHDNTDHHRLQLDIIKALYSKNPNLIIGMEMFQTTSQEVLDRWIRGELTEDTFLDEVEWYYKWDVPYSYYKDILDFAKDKGITVAALNIPRDLRIKVMSKGFDALTEEERKIFPTITPVTRDYKNYMKNNYRGHPGAHTPPLDAFVNTQSLWDDAMAESVLIAIDKKTLDNPQVVVITGGGHIVYGLGIPDRVYRRSSLTHAIVQPIGLEEGQAINVVQSIGTFVVGTKPSPHLSPVPRLGIAFTPREESDTGLLIRAVEEGSVAEKAGIKKGDVIMSFNGVEIKATHTLTRLIRDDIWGKTVAITVQREDEMITLEAIFPSEPFTTNDVKRL
ncbi:MAG: ChaN family lipoprotein [Thermodesulfobacteriota bacterium]